MALSRVIRTGNGTTTQFVVDFALGYLDQADVTARVGDEVDGAGNPVYRTITFLSDTLMQISGPPAGNGVRVVFERTVEKEDTLVHFSNGDVMDEENLDLSFKQILMVVHEVMDGRLGQFNNDLDMGGFRIGGLGDPVAVSDAANKRYVDSRIETAQNSATAAAASAAAAASSASASSAQATASALSATASEASRQAALVQAIRSSEFADASATSSTSSGLYADASAESRDNAFKWSSEQEDVQVNDGVHAGFSAYHWARKAEQSIGGVSSWAGLTGTITIEQAITSLNLEQYLALSGGTLTGSLVTAAATSSRTPFRIPHGVAPNPAATGGVWTTTGGLYYNINGTTRQSYDSGSLTTMTTAQAQAGTSTTVQAITASVLKDGVNAATASLATDVATLKSTNAGVKRGAAMTPSGTSAVYSGIPSGVSRVVMHFRNVAFSAGVVPIIRLGTSAGPVTTGYVGAQGNIAGSVGYAVARIDPTGLVMTTGGNVISILHGSITFTRVPGTNTWIFYGQFFGDGNYLYAQTYMGSITLPGEFDRIQYTSSAATATLSGASSMYAEWEF